MVLFKSFIYFSNIEVLGQDFRPERNIVLSSKVNLNADQNFFTIQYGMNDYTLPRDQQYRYRLIGYDDDWVEANNSRSATYTKVPGIPMLVFS